MALMTPEGPAEGDALVGRAVGDLMPPSTMNRLTAALTGGSAARTSRPIPIFVLDPESLDRPNPLETAERIGWRYVTGVGRQMALVDLAGADGAELRFNQMVRGTAPGRLLEACAWAERESGSDRVYEVRILAMPALHLEALWLAGESEDRFLLLQLPGSEPLREIEFLTEARRLAGERPESAADGPSELSG